VNLHKLKEAEAAFLQQYPGGFDNPEIAAIRKKRHNVDRMIAFAQESFAKKHFESPDPIAENMVKVIGRSSVISVFEKARFRDFANTLIGGDRKFLSQSLQELLHGDMRAGFEAMLDLLQTHKLGKWSLLTIIPTYYHPQREVLVKPNTVKAIISTFELTNLHYRPTPTWTFYEMYRSIFQEMKEQVDPVLSPTNAAFSWFLLLSTRREPLGT
jgi:hypothetical protein